MAQSHRAGRARASQAGSKRSFTLEHANRALVYVGRIVEQLVSAHKDSIEARASLEAAPPGTDRIAHQQRLAATNERLRELKDELAHAGVHLEDAAEGAVAFPSVHGGKPALIHWVLGQSAISTFRMEASPRTSKLPISQLQA